MGGLPFDKHHNEDWQVINKLIHNEDYKQAIEKVHGLKGAAGNLGLMEIYSTCQSLEKSLRKQQSDDVLLNNFRQLLETFHNNMPVIQLLSRKKLDDDISDEDLMGVLKQIMELL